MNYTKYEKARMVGGRALQISQGAPLLIELSEDEMVKIGYNPVKIARMEFDAGVIPMTVIRPHPNGEETRVEPAEK